MSVILRPELNRNGLGHWPPVYGTVRGVNWNHPLNRGLIAWWVMNEGSGNLLHDLVRNLTLTVNGTYAWEYTTVGPALRFNGSDVYAMASDDSLVSGGADRTFRLWVNMAASDGAEHIMLRHGQITFNSIIALELYQSKFFLSQYGDSFFSNGFYPYNAWTDVVVTINSGLWQLYFNGAADAYKSMTTSTVLSPTSDLYIGCGEVIRGAWFNGWIKGIEIWNRALTAREVAELNRCSFGTIDRPRLIYESRHLPMVGSGMPAIGANWWPFFIRYISES